MSILLMADHPDESKWLFLVFSGAACSLHLKWPLSFTPDHPGCVEILLQPGCKKLYVF